MDEIGESYIEFIDKNIFFFLFTSSVTIIPLMIYDLLCLCVETVFNDFKL